MLANEQNDPKKYAKMKENKQYTQKMNKIIVKMCKMKQNNQYAQKN